MQKKDLTTNYSGFACQLLIEDANTDNPRLGNSLFDYRDGVEPYFEELKSDRYTFPIMNEYIEG